LFNTTSVSAPPLTAQSCSAATAAIHGRRVLTRLFCVTSRHIHAMLRHMRTTVRLNEALLRRAKEEARRRGETLTSLIEQGVRLSLAGGQPRGEPARRPPLPVSRVRGGTLPGVDLDDSAQLLDRMEGRD
jgi:hypothetical protein